MSTIAPVSPDDLTPEECADPRLVRHLARIALEREVRRLYNELLPRNGWDLAIIKVTERLPVSRSRVEKLVWGGTMRRRKQRT